MKTTISSLIILFSFFYGCKSACDCYADKSDNKFTNSYTSPPWQRVTQIGISQIALSINKTGYNDIFGMHLLNKNGKYFFTYISGKDSLIIIDFDNNKLLYSKDFKPIVQSKEYYNGLFINDTFHFVDAWGKRYYQYKISDNWDFELLDTLRLEKFPDLVNWEIYPKVWGHGLQYSYPYLLFHYGSTKKKNYIDTKAYLKLNVKDKSIEKVVDYPECYSCTFMKNCEGSSVFLQDGSIATVFDQYDRLYLTSPGAAKNKNVTLSHDCKFWTFDKNKLQDLSYVRKYAWVGERNLDLINVSDQYFIVIKQHAKNNLNEKSVYSFFVFDSLYNQVYTEKISHKKNLAGVFNYKNGFLIFNDSLNKAFYYDFKK